MEVGRGSLVVMEKVKPIFGWTFELHDLIGKGCLNRYLTDLESPLVIANATPEALKEMGELQLGHFNDQLKLYGYSGKEKFSYVQDIGVWEFNPHMMLLRVFKSCTKENLTFIPGTPVTLSPQAKRPSCALQNTTTGMENGPPAKQRRVWTL
jgi:hypothetical protein